MTSYADSSARLARTELGGGLSGRLGGGWWRGPVATTLVVAAVLHLLWWLLLSSSGGDIAAQDAWAEFARSHPGTAYDLMWYGGMHPVSYSIVSPYVMALIGVRTTMMIAGTLSAGLVAWLLQRIEVVKRPLWPALYGALALTGNAVSGRVTFALGALFALVAVALTVLVADQPNRRVRYGLRAGIAVSGALATMSSPVAGLFLGLVAAALWLLRRRPDAYVIGVPPVVVVVASALLFPFSGEEPMIWSSAILPTFVALAVIAFVPAEWRTVRVSSAVYAVAVIASWLLPSPVGTNVSRLGLLFGGIVLVAALTSGGWRTSWWATTHPRPSARTLLALSLITATIWQVSVAGLDAVRSRPSLTTEAGLPALVKELQSRHAELGRVEVVPTRTHREAAALAPYVNLARGWNRQADVSRNPLFYQRDNLSATAYHRWLKRWAVSYVVISSAVPDPASAAEAKLVSAHPDYLHEVWTDGDWTLYEVSGTLPLVDAPATVVGFDAAVLTVTTPQSGVFTVRIPASPWLALVDADGKPIGSDDAGGACLSALNAGLSDEEAGKRSNWLVLHAPAPGTYRISAPYKLPRGSACSS